MSEEKLTILSQRISFLSGDERRNLVGPLPAHILIHNSQCTALEIQDEKIDVAQIKMMVHIAGMSIRVEFDLGCDQYRTAAVMDFDIKPAAGGPNPYARQNANSIGGERTGKIFRFLAAELRACGFRRVWLRDTLRVSGALEDEMPTLNKQYMIIGGKLVRASWT